MRVLLVNPTRTNVFANGNQEPPQQLTLQQQTLQQRDRAGKSWFNLRATAGCFCTILIAFGSSVKQPLSGMPKQCDHQRSIT